MMSQILYRARLLLLGLGFIILPLLPTVHADVPASAVSTNAWVPPQPAAEDGQIAFWTSYLLKNYHYSHKPFNDEVSSQFLDRYMEGLDPQHLHFFQSDLADFEKYRVKLDDLTQLRDTAPAFEIYSRFMERLRQRVDYSHELLKSEKFKFETDERIAIDRRESPYPKNLADAKKLWRQRLRYEYLQEKLGKTSAKKDKAAKEAESTEPPKSMHEEILDTLSHRYDRTLKMFTQWDRNDVLGIYLTALSRVYDPHSDYFNRQHLDQFKISMNLQLFGIGAELRSEDGSCKVAKLLPGGPAMKSKKINPEDVIVAVAQSNAPPVDVVDWELTKIVQMIRGPKGTEVRLTLAPAGKKSERREVTLIRDEIPLEDQAAKGKIIELPEANGETTRLGVINLPSFYAPMMEAPGAAKKEALGKFTSVDVAKIISKFKQENVKGIILDLRYNGGGSLEEAIRLTGLFIREGPVVQVRDMEGGIQVDKDSDPSVVYDGPLLVLTSRFSASASEIVAGALQDYGRALVVGDVSTHGKGTVQTVQSLRPLLRLNEADPEPGALKFTIRKFYRASGASTQLKGVTPDIVLPSRLNYSKDIGESALENPLPWDVIPGAKFQRVDMVQPYLSELMKRSNDRVATNQDFIYIREDIAEYRRVQEDKTISLNEKQRIREQEEAEARQKARDKELRARRESDEKVYEITLKNADLPGLPPPVQKTNSVAKVEADASNESTPATADEADEEEKLLTFDWNNAYLQEAQRIMRDYADLLSKKNEIVANQRKDAPVGGAAPAVSATTSSP